MKHSHSLFRRVSSFFLLTALLLSLLPISALKTYSATALTQNQINIVGRADYMYNATWVCQKTISGWKGQYTYYKGNTYRIPYAWPVTAGKWVGDTSYGISVNTFLKACADPDSDFYTKQSYYTGNAGSYAPYYGSDCSTFVTYCWGLSSRCTTSTIPNVSSLIGKVTASNVNSLLKVGDALNYAGSHVVLVTDIVYGADGSITSVEITEQTPPQLKRTNHTVASLVASYGANYKIYRYEGAVSAPPEGYVSVSTDPDSYTVPSASLALGAKGSEVSWVQAVLYQLGYTVDVDGIFGGETENAVSSFRSDYGLSNGLTVDSTVINKLIELWSNKEGYYITTASSLNMRAGDGTSYDIITTLPSGTQVAVIGFNSAGTWANVIYNGTEGWLSKSYISFLRKFNYTLNYNTNISDPLPSVSFRHDRSVTVPEAPLHPEGALLKGWQLLRASDLLWFNGSEWVSSQSQSKLFSPDDTVTFSSALLNPKAGDDSFYLCAVWADAVIEAVTPSDISPSGFGWTWSDAESYGYFSGYGSNGENIELCVDLALLPSEDQTPTAIFYTDGTSKQMTVSPFAVTVGSKSVSYDWGAVSADNWHDVKFKINNGIGYVFIDGELILSDAGFTANTAHQFLFSFPGQMAIDNAVLVSDDGTEYFNCDFEDEAYAAALMGSGLGERVLLFPKEELPTGKPGDINGDEKLSSLDSNLLKRIIAGSINPTEEQRSAADINGDGRINSFDSYLQLCLILSIV